MWTPTAINVTSEQAVGARRSCKPGRSTSRKGHRDAEEALKNLRGRFEEDRKKNQESERPAEPGQGEAGRAGEATEVPGL